MDAIDDAARSFYQHFDLPLPATKDRLFLPMATIARLFRKGR